MAGPEDSAPLPSLPEFGDEGWFTPRNAFDLEVKRRLETYLSPTELLAAYGGAGGMQVVPVTQAGYDALQPPDPNTLYVIVGTLPPSSLAPVITTTELSTMTLGVPFSQVIEYTGSTVTSAAPSAGALPAGLGLNVAGGVVTLAGTPTAAVGFSVSIALTNVNGTTSKAFGGSVNASATAPNIQTTTLNALQVGTAFTQTLAKTGTAPITFARTAGALPSGLTLNATTGVISGTPDTAGAYSFTITATNSVDTDVQAFSGTVVAAPAPGAGDWVQPSLPSGYSTQFGATAPLGTPSDLNDAPSTYQFGNRFYTTRVGGASIIGARVWNPVGASAEFLESPLTAYAYLDLWNGTAVKGIVTFGHAAARSKAATGKRTAGTWSAVLFDTPLPLPQMASGATSLLTIAFNVGTHYVHSPTALADATSTPGTSGDIHLAESNGIVRAVHNLSVNDGEVFPAGPIYGVDFIAASA